MPPRSIDFATSQLLQAKPVNHGRQPGRLLDDNQSGLPANSSQPFLCRLFAQRKITVHRRSARFGRAQTRASLPPNCFSGTTAVLPAGSVVCL